MLPSKHHNKDRDEVFEETKAIYVGTSSIKTHALFLIRSPHIQENEGKHAHLHAYRWDSEIHKNSPSKDKSKHINVDNVSGESSMAKDTRDSINNLS